MNNLPPLPPPPPEGEALNLWIDELLRRQPEHSVPHINDYVERIQNSEE